MTAKTDEQAECHGCGIEVSLDSQEFEEEWVKTVYHSESSLQRNLVLCLNCQEHRFTGQSVLEITLVYLDNKIGKIDRKIQTVLGVRNA